jgi:DNA polymerase-3 subunit epsilon
MRAASAAQRYERAAWLRRRARRLESLLRRLGGALRAAHAGARVVLVPHPADAGRADAFWIVGGRIADWGPLPDADELAARTDAALAAAPAPGPGGWLPADELDETRIIGLWLAGHEEDVRVLELEPRPDQAALARLSASLSGDRPTRAPRAAPATASRAPAAVT